MKGPWHYKEAERLGQLATDKSDRLANKGAMVANQAEVEQRTISQLIALAQVHATLAVAASTTTHAFFDVELPVEWAQAFANGVAEAEIVETPQGRMRQDYKRNRAQGRDQVESAARAMLGLT